MRAQQLFVAAAFAFGADAARLPARYNVDWSFPEGRYDRVPLRDSNGPSLQIFNCSDDPAIAPNQIWTWNSTYNEIILASTGNCIDVEDYSISDQSTIWTYTCHPEDKDPTQQNQAWSFNANGTITELMSGSCMDVSQYGTEPGSQVWLFHCTGAPNQQWTIQNVTGGFRIVGVQSGLCLDGGTVINACDYAPMNTMDFCNASLPLPQRVLNIVNNTPTTEAWGLFNTQSSGVGSLLIGPYQWWSEALHGVAYSPGVSFGGALPGATSFPHVCTSGMALNRTLWHAIGSTISTEARAFNNLNQAGLTFWAPNINIFRDPRWGRGQETAGEDPFLTSQYVTQFVTGMQEGEDPRYLKVSSCCKHYAAYSLESWNGTDRHHFNAVVTAQDEIDTYLPAFQACVQDAKVSSIMCSYNAVNGIPSCANDFLLNTIARGQWGFSDASYITSDCGAVSDIQYAHAYTNNANDTCKVTLEGGTDIGCDGFLPPALPAAVASGDLSMDTVNTAMAHMWGTRMRLGMFDSAADQPYRQIPPSAVCTAESQALALDAAQQGMTLLKNSAKGLPLSTTAVKTLAVIGPNAQATNTMQGNYYGSPCNTIASPATALAAFATVNFVQGCDIASNSSAGIAAAVTAAAAADATVLVVGIDQSQESEGNDRVIISFPGVQSSLISQVCAASKGPCIVVVMAGGSVDVSAQLADDNVAAMLWTGYPGEAGGVAIANTLFAEGGNVPAGRLVQTIYPADYVNQISMFEMNVRPGPSMWPPFNTPGRTYRFYTGTPVLPFGFGLSYTTFTYAIASAPAALSMAATRAYLAQHAAYGAAYAPRSSAAVGAYFVNVTNTGAVDADDVVMGFSTPPGAGTNGVPLQELFGFERVFVPAGATVTVYIGVHARDLTRVTAAGERVAAPGAYTFSFGVKRAAEAGMGYAQHTVVAA